MVISMCNLNLLNEKFIISNNYYKNYKTKKLKSSNLY